MLTKISSINVYLCLICHDDLNEEHELILSELDSTLWRIIISEDKQVDSFGAPTYTQKSYVLPQKPQVPSLWLKCTVSISILSQ